MRKTILIMIIAVLLTVGSVFALRNPAATYCDALNYTYAVEKDSEGNDVGYCTPPSGEKIEAWSFLRGEEGSDKGYCVRHGMKTKTVSDERCMSIYSTTCSVCVLKNGTETEVTTLMGLDFSESTCGDNNCGFPENSATCPNDCPTSGMDMYCEQGNKNDPDCVLEEQAKARNKADPAQKQNTQGTQGMVMMTIWIVLVVIVVGVVVGLLLMKNHKRKKHKR